MNRLKRCVFLAAAGVFLSAAAEELSYPAKLPKGVVRNDGGNVELGGGTWFAFRDFPVQARQRCRLKVQARVKSGNAAETVPVLEQLLKLEGVRKPKTASVIYEYRTGNRLLPVMYQMRGLSIFSTEFREYLMEFYAIDGADAVRVLIRTNDPGNTVEVKSAEIVPVDMDQEKYLNVNPDLKFGPYNTCGYGGGSHAVYDEDDRGPFLDVGPGWRLGDWIPVNAGERLKISWTGEPAEGAGPMRVKMWFHNTAQSQIRYNMAASKLPMQATKKNPSGTEEIVVPEGMSWMRITFSHGLLRGIRIERTDGSK